MTRRDCSNCQYAFEHKTAKSEYHKCKKGVKVDRAYFLPKPFSCSMYSLKKQEETIDETLILSL